MRILRLDSELQIPKDSDTELLSIEATCDDTERSSRAANSAAVGPFLGAGPGGLSRAVLATASRSAHPGGVKHACEHVA